ncbi:NAD(P)-dependent oxidoreductase [Chitinophaga qingshengii]|uniref:Hydroxyacid dehydrogenase n=1 Tax=Chitinophaga qingshengii TaxID=1569794 RepID=A0ABR7TH89_9BACT|nr:NAD(P)-dependent oxidoreductase [Chitinophaga qingshengii]MBC9929857.1 hydroxyacid dehydrogenase [Chitinophaga qingshengii]
MKIFVTAPYHEQGLQTLRRQFGEVIYQPWKPHGRAFNEAELLTMLQAAQPDALITEHDQVTEKVITANPQLQFIGVCRGTPSNVAVATATAMGIPVFFTPARNAQAVAELFLSNVILLLRQTMPAMQWLKDRQWQAGAHDSYLYFKGNELAGKTIGMIGFGAIGQLIARMVKDFPCPIQFYDPYVPEQGTYRKTTLEDVFASSDIVSVHLPVTSATKGMINGQLLKMMKKDAIFINTARSAVVQREGLLEVLEKKLIRGAILDVFDNEPPDELDYRIIDMPHVIATPHIAGATFEVEDHHVNIMNRALLQWYAQDNKQIAELANKDLLKVHMP